MNLHYSTVSRCVISAGLLFAATASSALDSTWQGGPSGDWNVAGNWTAGIPQAAADTATFNSAATVNVPGNISLKTLTVNASAPVTITVASGAKIAFENNGGTVIDTKSDTVINGAGDITLSRNGTDVLNFADIRPAAGTTLTIAARISGQPDSGVELNLAGTLLLTNPLNSFTGFSRISVAGGVIQFSHPGALGLKAARLEQASPSKFSYVGSGAAVMPIGLSVAGGSTVFENAGSGPLTINGTVTGETTGGKTVTFSLPNGQDIILGGTVSNGAGTLNLAPSGTGALVLNGAASAATYTVDQGATLALGPAVVLNGTITVNSGGTLAVESGATCQSPTLVMNSGANVLFNRSAAAAFAVTMHLTNSISGAGIRWTLPTAATSSTVTIPTLVRANGGSLDIAASNLGTAQNKLLIGNFTAGPLPGWVTVNNGPGIYDATLGVMPMTAGGSASLAALGDTIQNGPTVANAIDIDYNGTTGGITLAGDPTAIFSLTQGWANDPATVNLGGQTLITSIIDITSSGNDLTLANGTLTAPTAQIPPAGPAVFPTLPTQPVFWLDFADALSVTTNAAGRITGVINKGTKGAALNVAVPAKFAAPLYVPNAVNGLGVARADSIAPQQALATLSNSGITGSSPRTLFLVASRSPVTQTQFYALYMGDDVAGVSRDFAIVERAGNISFSTKGNDLDIAPASPVGHNALTFITGLNSQPNDGAGYRNGDLVASKTFAFNTIDAPIFVLHRPLGNGGNVSGPGEVAETLLFDYTLDPAERAAVEAYLMHKWGIVPERTDAPLVLANANAASELTVSAALTEPYGTYLSLIKSGPGDVTITGPATFSGLLTLNEGTLTLDTPAGHTTLITKPISGPGKLVKDGPGNLMTSLANPYAGGTLIQAGTLYPGDVTGSLGTGPVRIENGAALDIVYTTKAYTNPISVEGFGPDGLGALRSGNFAQDQQNAFNNVTLTADTAFFSGFRFDVRNGAFDFGGHNLTLNGGGIFSIVNSAVSGVSGANVHAEKGLFNFETSDFKGSPANTASAAPGGILSFYNISAPFLWSSLLDDNAEMRGSTGDMNTNVNVIAGPVTLSAGTARFNPVGGGTLAVTGTVSGNGGLLKEGPGWLWLLNPANTYQGATTITQGNLYAVSPSSISSPLTVTGDGATLIARAASASSADGWTDSDIQNTLTTTAGLAPNTYFGFDTCYADLSYTHAYPYTGIKKLGPHKLTLTGSAPDLGGVTVYNGELDLSGTGSHNLHTYSVNVGYQPDTAALAVLRLADASLDTLDPGFNLAGPSLTVGGIGNTRGILHIGAGARANGRIILGNAATAAGAIYQTSGVVTNTGGQANDSVIGPTGYGYYRLDNGEFATKGATQLGRDTGSTGIFEQRGGTALINPGGAPTTQGTVGDYYNGTFSTRTGVSQFMLSGGTLNLNYHSFTLGEWSGDNGYGSLTLENDAQMFGVTVLTLANRNASPEAYINLNGGVLSLTREAYIIKGGNNNTSTAKAGISFDGGTLQVAPATVAPSSLVRTGANNTPAVLNVFPGGATIDIVPGSGLVTLDQPLRAPTGFGISSVTVTSPGAGYIGPPAVTFSGGNGAGATAFAEIDLPSGKVTAIRVTSPGSGYTAAPTITLRGGGFTTAAAASVAVGIPESGGLTKAGAGTLLLNAANTYTGPTVVSDGILRFGAGSQTLTAATPITLTGGILDLGGAAYTNAKPVTIGSGGGIVNGTLLAPSIEKSGPGTATLDVTPLPPIPVPTYEAAIAALEPLIWYDPSDTTPGNVTTNSTGRVTNLRNKGTGGPNLDSIPYPVGTGIGARLDVGFSPCGANVLQVDGGTATMTTLANVPISGQAPRTLITLLARDNGSYGRADGRACIVLGSGGEGLTFELGTGGEKTYLSGIGASRDTQWTSPLPPADQLVVVAAVNGYGGNFIRGVQLWRWMTPAAPLETLTANWPADCLIAESPFGIARRGTGVDNARGRYGDILVFDRILSVDEITTVKDILMAKYLTGETDEGNDSEPVPTVTVSDGTLVLAIPTSSLGEDTIAKLGPVAWYDPSDASTTTTNTAGRITQMLNKGTLPNMTASSGVNNGGTALGAPLLKTGANSYSRTGLPMLSVDANNEGLASASNIGITGSANRTTVGVFARHNNTDAGPVASFGNAGGAQMWEFGDRHNGTVLGGYGGGNNDLIVNPVNPVCSPDVFIFTYENLYVNFWRTLTAPLSATMNTVSAAYPSGFNTINSPFIIGQRIGMAGRADFRGQIGELAVFDRALSEPERASVQRYLISKWMSGEGLSADADFNGVTFDVAAGATLDLNGIERTGITVTGNGTIANGSLGDGFTISPAGDDEIGILTFANVTFGAGSTYRVTTSANSDASDLIILDGADLSALTLVPATGAMPNAPSYTVATGTFTGKPALDGFPSKYKLLKKGNDLLLTSAGGTILLVR